MATIVNPDLACQHLVDAVYCFANIIHAQPINSTESTLRGYLQLGQAAEHHALVETRDHKESHVEHWFPPPHRKVPPPSL